jgi:hypothetical protein
MSKPKYIKTPEILWEMFEAYKDKVQSNPRLIDKALQSGKVVQEALRVPLTLEGFELFCWDEVGCVEEYFRKSSVQ